MNNQKIAAIFDVDGTLIAGATLERIFIRFLRRRGELGWREIFRWLGAAAKAAARGRLRLKAIKAYLRGKDSTDRKSTRLNSSHLGISYAVFCLKKKKNRV